MKKSISLIKFFFVVLDGLVFFLSLILVLYLRFHNNAWLEFGKHFLSFILLLPFYFLFLTAFNFYNIFILNLRTIFLNLINFFLIVLIFSSFYFYFGQAFFSVEPKTNLFLFVLIFSGLVFLIRFISLRLRNQINVYFIGNKDLQLKLRNDLRGNLHFIFNETFDINNIKDNSVLIIGGHYLFDESYLQLLFNQPLTTFDFVSFYEKFFGRIPLEAIDFDLLAKEFIQTETKVYFYLKRLFDLSIGLFFFVIFIIIFPLIALFIFLNSPGSIFFVQKRIGYRGREFSLIKFRTMHQGNDRSQWAVGEEKKRIFFVGKILRKTHLDELPQVINLLKGDISVVGPRPEQPIIARDLEKEIPFYRLRYLVKPGITGWAQVNYKYPETIEETKIKLEYDLFYLKNHNLFLDLLILIKTFQKLFF
jgi:lipopolysaccharide/colanic/teichoic acid biosynthesis glycosyltransferase